MCLTARKLHWQPSTVLIMSFGEITSIKPAKTDDTRSEVSVELFFNKALPSRYTKMKQYWKGFLGIERQKR